MGLFLKCLRVLLACIPRYWLRVPCSKRQFFSSRSKVHIPMFASQGSCSKVCVPRFAFQGSHSKDRIPRLMFQGSRSKVPVPRFVFQGSFSKVCTPAFKILLRVPVLRSSTEINCVCLFFGASTRWPCSNQCHSTKPGLIYWTMCPPPSPLLLMKTIPLWAWAFHLLLLLSASFPPVKQLLFLQREADRKEQIKDGKKDGRKDGKNEWKKGGRK